MQQWNEFTDWWTSQDAQPVIFASAVIFVAIILSGLLAAWISRGTVRGLLNRSDRQQRASAVAALVDAATEASVWNSLTPAEQVLSDRAVGQADIQVRLLPIRGTGIAANWASHQLAEMKRNSATFGYQLDPAVAEFRDRLIEWQNKPARAKRIFQSDLERWRFEGATPAAALDAEQDAWVARQHHEKHAVSVPPVPQAPAAVAETVASYEPAPTQLMDASYEPVPAAAVVPEAPVKAAAVETPALVEASVETAEADAYADLPHAPESLTGGEERPAYAGSAPHEG